MAVELVVPQQHGLGSVSGSPLEPFVQGFLEQHFLEQVQTFVKHHSPEFCVACADGSFPLRWTELHKVYRQMFDRQLQSVVQEEGFSRDDFREYCLELSQSAGALADADVIPGSPGVCAAQFREFIKVLTASEDFEGFLRIMFDQAIRGQENAMAVQPGGPPRDPAAVAADPGSQEIEVAVPEGMGPGHALAVEYLGARYELVVPEGFLAGTTFRAVIALPSAAPV
mmetsp:Transcript_124619/g.248689  ORF Transcript_124619/g.248689 Transcript_124619/m.248689 type:complete len:226 (+) Transcript_124619:90-767(+)